MMNRHLSRIEKLVLKACEELNCRLYLLEWSAEGLHVYIDKKPEGVSLLECEQVSKRIGLFLESEGQNLPLEVSSPGLNRKLKYPWHFSEAVGQVIQAVVLQPVEGRKKFKGRLTRAGEKEIVLENPDELLKILYENIQKAHLVFDLKQNKSVQSKQVVEV